MNNNKLIKISSITKKLLVGLLGSFLLVFLLFHASANLFILADDGGDAYSAFCHFMGSNALVKVFEVVLLGTFVLHICLTAWLWFSNRGKRPVRYHERSKTKTAQGSKLAMITGSLLLVCLLFHFYDFYFVKMNFVKGTYMAKVEDFMVTPETEMSEEAQMILMEAVEQQKFSKDMQWIRQISTEEKEVLEASFPQAEFEPDFYHIARQKFSILHIVIGYLLFFAVVGVHIRHGFESAFQTFGLNHHKYTKLITVLGKIYCWVVCLAFAAVPLGVYFGL